MQLKIIARAVTFFLEPFQCLKIEPESSNKVGLGSLFVSKNLEKLSAPTLQLDASSVTESGALSITVRC